MRNRVIGVGVAVTVMALSATIAMIGPAHATTGSTPGWMGVYPGNSGTAGVTSYENYVGGPVHYVTCFLDTTDWKFVDRPQDFANCPYANQGYRVVISVPMIPTDSGNTLEQGAAGQLNSNFEDLAQQLVSMNMPNAIIRLGWELSGGWYPWSAQQNPTAFAEYWRQVVTTMRSVPGTDFQFDWNGGAAGQTGYDPTTAYPGNAYVDYISADVYDWAPAYYTNNTTTPATTQTWWNNTVLNGTNGLNWTATFAAAHNKPMALPEWGLMNRPDGQGGGDDPTFIQDIYNFITTHNVAYADYFNYDTGSGVDGNLQDGHFPKAATLYQKLFGPTTPIATR